MDIKPEVTKMLIERYNRIDRLNVLWNEANKDKLQHSATFRGPEKGHTEKSTAKVRDDIEMNVLSKNHILNMPNRKRKPYRDAITMLGTGDLLKKHTIPEVGLGDPKDDTRLAKPDTDLSFDPIMRPVPPEEQQLVHDVGRREYLKVRNRIKPEDKYYFPETMAWAYGWRLKDSVFGSQMPLYGRAEMLTKSMNRGGLKPYPQEPCDYKKVI